MAARNENRVQDENPYRSPECGTPPPPPPPAPDDVPWPSLGRRLGLGALAGGMVGATAGALIGMAMWLLLLLGVFARESSPDWETLPLEGAAIVFCIALIAGALLGGVTGVPLGTLLAYIDGRNRPTGAKNAQRKQQFVAISIAVWTVTGLFWRDLLLELLLATPDTATEFNWIATLTIVPGAALAGFQFTRTLKRLLAPARS